MKTWKYWLPPCVAFGVGFLATQQWTKHDQPTGSTAGGKDLRLYGRPSKPESSPEPDFEDTAPATGELLKPPFSESLPGLIQTLSTEPDSDWSRLTDAMVGALKTDQEAAVDAIPPIAELPSPAIAALAEAFVSHGETLPREALLELALLPVTRNLSDAQGQLLAQLAEMSWQDGLETIEATLEQLDFSAAQAFMTHATRRCPDEHSRAWAELMIGTGQFHQILNIPAAQGDDALTWLDGLMTDHPETRPFIEGSRQFWQSRYAAPIETDLKTRLDALVQSSSSKKAPEEVRRDELQQLLRVKVEEVRSAWLEEDPSPLTLVSKGELNMDALLETLPPDINKLLEEEPMETKRHLFTHLAAADPQAAVGWLADLPAEDAHTVIMTGASNLARDPKRLMELFNAYPYNPSQGPLQQRFMRWTGATLGAYRTYGESYAEWLIQLPTSVDRDMGLGALSHDLRSQDPELATRLFKAKNFVPPGK